MVKNNIKNYQLVIHKDIRKLFTFSYTGLVAFLHLSRYTTTITNNKYLRKLFFLTENKYL